MHLSYCDEKHSFFRFMLYSEAFWGPTWDFEKSERQKLEKITPLQQTESSTFVTPYFSGCPKIPQKSFQKTSQAVIVMHVSKFRQKTLFFILKILAVLRNAFFNTFFILVSQLFTLTVFLYFNRFFEHFSHVNTNFLELRNARVQARNAKFGSFSHIFSQKICSFLCYLHG